MSAVMDKAPEQLGIEGLAPPTEPHAALVIAGRLAHRAVLRVSVDGRPHLTVEIRQRNAADTWNFVATYHGAAAEHEQLEAQVQRLAAGTAVLVRGAGLECNEIGTDEHHPAPHLRVVDVLVIREIAFDDLAEASLL